MNPYEYSPRQMAELSPFQETSHRRGEEGGSVEEGASLSRRGTSSPAGFQGFMGCVNKHFFLPTSSKQLYLNSTGGSHPIRQLFSIGARASPCSLHTALGYLQSLSQSFTHSSFPAFLQLNVASLLDKQPDRPRHVVEYTCHILKIWWSSNEARSLRRQSLGLGFKERHDEGDDCRFVTRVKEPLTQASFLSR